MFKLVILIEPQEDPSKFEQAWPRFLALAEKMPGLERESASPVHAHIYGGLAVSMIHELYFESRQALKEAMSSPEGTAAGEVLQAITNGKVTLLFADHLEDEIINIQAHQTDEDVEPPGDKI